MCRIKKENDFAIQTLGKIGRLDLEKVKKLTFKVIPPPPLYFFSAFFSLFVARDDGWRFGALYLWESNSKPGQLRGGHAFRGRSTFFIWKWFRC